MNEYMNKHGIWQAIEELDFMVSTLLSFEIIDGEDYDRAMTNLEVISDFVKSHEKEENNNE